jgi:hypothetical protein
MISRRRREVCRSREASISGPAPRRRRTRSEGFQCASRGRARHGQRDPPTENDVRKARLTEPLDASRSRAQPDLRSLRRERGRPIRVLCDRLAGVEDAVVDVIVRDRTSPASAGEGRQRERPASGSHLTRWAASVHSLRREEREIEGGHDARAIFAGVARGCDIRLSLGRSARKNRQGVRMQSVLPRSSRQNAKATPCAAPARPESGKRKAVNAGVS